jgi:ubiquinone/menaquinone biosynthesis C-methylase UbiE
LTGNWKLFESLVSPFPANVALSDLFSSANSFCEAFTLTETAGNGPHWCYQYVSIPAGTRLEAKLVVRKIDADGLRVRLYTDDWVENAQIFFDHCETSIMPSPFFDGTFIGSDLVHLRIKTIIFAENSLLNIGLMLLSDSGSSVYEGIGRSVKIECFSFTNVIGDSEHFRIERRKASMHCRTNPFGRKAYELCKGKGLEIGALHKPFDLDATVIYLDRNRTDFLRTQYRNDPRVNNIVQVQIVWQDSTYPFFDDNAFDFVINSHVLEHVTNPGRSIAEWLRIIQPGGILYMVVPDKNFCFDRRRAVTTVSHLMNEYDENVNKTTIEHYEDFILYTQGEDAGNY